MASRKPLSTAGLTSTMATIEEAKALLVTHGNHSFDADIAKIRPDPEQPRKLFARDELSELATTMRNQGQLQPVLLRPDPAVPGSWIIVAGERRWRAAELNGWSTILAIEFNGDHEVARLLENLQRIDLTPVEEARGIYRLIEEKGWTQTQAAEALGKSKSETSSLLRILDLPEDILDGVSTSKLALSRNVLSELARVPEGAVRERLLNAARTGDLTLRMVRAGGNTLALPKQQEETSGSAPRIVRQIGPQALHRVADHLQTMRETRQTLDSGRRTALLRIREEIDRFLAMDDANETLSAPR